MQSHLFEVLFSDGTTFSGGTLQESLWKNIPKKQISRLFYLLPSGDYLALASYDKYYHMIECTRDFYGGSGQINLEYAYVIGKIDNFCRVYKINLKNHNIEEIVMKSDDEFIKKLNAEYWR